jgi:hypothetical protein
MNKMYRMINGMHYRVVPSGEVQFQHGGRWMKSHACTTEQELIDLHGVLVCEKCRMSIHEGECKSVY